VDVVKAIRIHENGGHEILRCEDVDLPPPEPREARIRHTAIAVNFSDVNVRRGGFYIARPLRFPVILGNEAAGVVESVGTGVSEVRPGDRVCYAGTGGPFYEDTGAYAEARNLPASCLIRLPDSISDQQAAALLLKGLTASMIVNRVFRPKHGETILIHGAASGVGLLLCQWSKHLGATVIGTVGSRNKVEVARNHGCDHAVLYREVDFVEEVRRLFPQGVSAVFDGVGKDTFEKSLDCLRPFGMIVNYGNASGHPLPLDLILLAKKGSLSVSRPGVSSFQSDSGLMAAACAELFDFVARGVLKVYIHKTYALCDAAQAHRDLEERKTIGSLLLIPPREAEPALLPSLHHS
jgi:NADPH2:quinone reductase